MWPDRVSNPGLLTYESGALPIALCSPTLYCIQRWNLGRVKNLIWTCKLEKESATLGLVHVVKPVIHYITVAPFSHAQATMPFSLLN